jgi:hypothetical protein
MMQYSVTVPTRVVAEAVLFTQGTPAQMMDSTVPVLKAAMK